MTWDGRPAGAEEITQELPPQRREVYGRIYELILRGQPEGVHRYVGRTTQTIHQRVHGRGGHTSPDSVARDPWKAAILPGRAGYRQLEVVYRTGLGEDEDKRALARAEAFWIDRLRPDLNEVRPVRPRVTEQPVRRRSTPAPARRRVSGRKVALLSLMAIFTTLAAFLLTAMHLPWPAVPWVGSPIIGTLLAWRVFWSATRKARRIRRALR